MRLSIKSSDTKQIQSLFINELFWVDVLDFIQKRPFGNFKQTSLTIVLETNFCITYKVVLTLINTRNHQKLKLLPFSFYLQLY